jgi:hypothetical protein
MDTVQDTDDAARSFSPDDWNKQLEADVAAGRLDRLAEEALKDLREGRCADL